MDQFEIRYGAEVAAARRDGRPVVALESTIVAHGLPRPDNLRVAREIEQVVRDNGAVPATVGMIGGELIVGLDDAQLTQLATADGVAKLSVRDLALAAAAGVDGATTVAGTSAVAAAAGIRVFATGGIGGVHRGVAETWDVSADLEELARTPVIVVSAGAKAILDLPKTLEVLETKGVPVVGFGTDEFPAFWSRSSGLRAPLRLDRPEEVARLWAMQRMLGLAAGILVANPIPPAHEIPREEIEPAIAAALKKARGAEGKRVTPALLEAVLEATGGRSLEANIALVLNNARLAAEIAVALAAREDGAVTSGRSSPDS